MWDMTCFRGVNYVHLILIIFSRFLCFSKTLCIYLHSIPLQFIAGFGSVTKHLHSHISRRLPKTLQFPTFWHQIVAELILYALSDVLQTSNDRQYWSLRTLQSKHYLCTYEESFYVYCEGHNTSQRCQEKTTNRLPQAKDHRNMPQSKITIIFTQPRSHEVLIQIMIKWTSGTGL